MDTILLNKLPAVEDMDSVSGETFHLGPLCWILSLPSVGDVFHLQYSVFMFSYLLDGLLRMQRLAVKRLIDIGIGVLVPLVEQLAKPLPHAMVLATLDEISSGFHKELPAGTPPRFT